MRFFAPLSVSRRMSCFGFSRPMNYQSGEKIRKGDWVLYHGEPGEIELVVDRFVGDPAMDWYMKELGRGVMVVSLRSFGRVYICDTENDEDLEFLSRGQTPT